MIDVEVDELVLIGFGERDRDRVARAIERELERLLRRRGSLAAVAVDGRSVRSDGQGPDAIGRAVARAVAREIEA